MNPKATLRALVPTFLLVAATAAEHVLAPNHTAGLFPKLGYLVQNATAGLIVALLAVGIALIYRTSRAINFAAAELGLLPATLASLLILVTGWPYWLATLCGLASAVVLGIVVEFVFIRRFFEAPRLIVTVATVGVAQVLFFGTLLLNLAFGSSDRSTFDPAVNVDFTIGDTRFDGHDAAPMVLVPLVLVALGLFLRYSAFGQAIRGAAERSERASLLGIPVKRMQSVVWCIATVISFIAMMLFAGSTGLPRSTPLGAETLTLALAAAVVGGMDRIPTIALTAVSMSVFAYAVRTDWPVAEQFSFVVAIVAAIAVFVTRDQRRNRRDRSNTFDAVREARPVPAELRHLKPVRLTRAGMGLVLLVIVTTLPSWLPDSKMLLVTKIAIFAIVGVSLVILTGWAGQVSLGQMAVAAFGAAAAAGVTTHHHWDLSLALLVGALAGAVVLVVVGLPALRAGGLSLGITTLALALAVGYLLDRSSAPWFMKNWLPDFSGPDGQFRPRLFGKLKVDDPGTYFFVVLAVLALAIVMAKGLRRSRSGRVLIGLRENDRAAQAYGVSPLGARITALAFSGALAGLAGTLLVFLQRDLFVKEYDFYVGLQVFSMVVIGGLGSIGGAIAGAVYYQSARYFLPNEWTFLASGLGLLLVLMLVPGGLGAAFGDLRDGVLRWYAKRKQIRVPSLVADTRVEEMVAPAHAVEMIAEAESVGEEMLS